ncbi:MAG TPA: translation elongation factor Ts [Amaricoccus sp.]|uniref:translation elongation factor Ts n=1 Tax=Amaricoccus sp. TaxID=1872485 RepID=UPI002C87C097|nr:translation elongation factor Ts [Amaricoccus sp.]HMQ91751.1 translation elongation factor Ts [Amaricoccus sp.]HMR51371.1 translation elongation factor Ts [Amaricoccus sp.]HMR60401.1 translation elongation factor Ts [Amaricoccus sp.]HMT98185.1 translation elongation factor Ts [Amaricoccus sp.]
MSISATMVKELRDASGAGMMDAKKALTETDGDMEAAIDWLRTKGLAKAAKKSGRTAAEGLVGVAVRGGVGVAVEVNSETDFVARNSDFQAIVRAIAEVATGCNDIEELRDAPMDDKTVQDAVTAKIATIGENLHLRRMASVEGGSVASYVHNAVAENLGKIGVLVALKGADNGIGKQIAMHIAATNPASLSEADLDPALVAREKAVLTEQARESGKPEGVIEKMIVGRMNKFFEEVTLLKQKFVINPDISVGQAAKEAGVEVVGFARLAVGEGVEKATEDFAAEVAKTAGR